MGLNYFSKLKLLYQKNKFIFKILLIFLFFILLWIKVDFSKITAIEIKWVWYGLMMVMFSHGFGNLSWYFILNALRKKGPLISFKKVIGPYWLGLFFNNFMPTSIGGDVIKGFSMHQVYKNPLKITLSILIDRLFGLMILMGIGINSWLFFFYKGKVFLFFCLAEIMMIGVLFLLPKYFFWVLKKGFKSFGWFGKKYRLVLKIILLLKEIYRQKKWFLLILGMMGLSQLLKVLMNGCLILGLEKRGSNLLPAEYVFFLVPIYGILALISLTPGGLGVKEYLCVLLFKNVPFLIQGEGVGNFSENYIAEITLLSLLSHLVVMISSLGGRDLFFI